MAGGWAKDGAVQEQIDASVEEGIQRVRSRMMKGESAKVCEECGDMIPQARREALPGVQYCVQCQAELELNEITTSAINRRGSKDSQLR
ncbi:DksA/TraR family C4-type zinc finger protein [Alteromonas pelagimontana]|uniref:DksA/TraR family C4-type zinc finger protein n=1 Tax=Alteromonas pelagimontana TaxID=1858656 RepID=A0A6M4MCN1_9ALTE|nr:DksA/TraR family C4-type zinc finger protein [Alteromonas pelagimontana]QJR80315.1 DksA/TraR family C4-type zinc finger protein [Alteromonas pelagimontana]